MRPNPPLLLLCLILSFTPVAGCDSDAALSAEEHIQRAKDFESKKQHKAATIELKNAVNKAPDNAEARLLLGQLYVQNGLGEAAEKELLRARELGIRTETILPMLGTALIQQGAFQKALDSIQAQPDFSSLNQSRILSVRADALIGLGKIGTGCTLYKEAHQTDANNIVAYHGLAACAWASGKREEAMQWLDRAVAVSPTDAITLRLLGQRHLEAGKLDQAADYFKRSVAANPSAIATRTQLGILYLMLNRLEPARAEARDIRNIVPRHPDADYLEAFALYLDKKPDEALTRIQQALKNGKDVPAYLMLQGSILLDQGSFEQAQQAFARVLLLQPGHTAARKFQALAALRLGQPQASEKLLQPLLLASVQDTGALALAGKAELAQGQWLEAERHQRAILAREPENAAALIDLGQALANQGKLDEALSLFEQAHKYSETTGDAYLLRIRTHLRAGQPAAALKLAQDRIRLEPKTSNNYLFAARAQLALKQRDGALQTLRQGLSQSPDSLDMHAMLSALLLEDKRTTDAEKLWRGLLERQPGNVIAMLALANIASLGQRSNDANAWLDRAARAAPDSPAVALTVASRELAANNPGKAINALRGALQTHPDRPDLLGALGEAQLAAQDPSNARSNFERAVQYDTRKNPRWRLGLALAEFSLGNLKLARAHLDKILAEQPRYYPAYENLVLLAMRENKPDEGLKLARRSQQALPGLPGPYLLEGDILLAQRKWDEAVAPLAKAHAMSPGSNTLLKLFRARSRNGSVKTSDAMLNDWINRHPQDIDVRLARAELHLSRLDLPSAEADYRAVLAVRPNQLNALNNLAFILQGKNPAESLDFARRAYEQAPDNPNILDTYGWLMVTSQGGNLSQGLKLLEKAVGKAPQNPGYRLHYARALVQAKQTEEARRQLTPLTTLKPGPIQTEAAALLASLDKKTP